MFRVFTVFVRIRLSMMRQWSPYPAPTCTNFSRTDSSRHSQTTRYMRPVIIYYRLIIAFDTALLLQWSYKFITSLFSRALLFSCIKQSSLLNQIVLHVITCTVELTNDVIWLNLVIFISLCTLFINDIISCPEKILNYTNKVAIFWWNCKYYIFAGVISNYINVIAKMLMLMSWKNFLYYADKTVVY